MPLQLLPSTPGELGNIGLFLREVFGSPASAPFVEPKLLYWKYCEPHAAWPGSRSYTLRQGEEIAAHGCIWPLAFEIDGKAVTCNHLIDWAANPRVPGAGLSLLRHFAKLTDTLLTIGGSDTTRQMLPRFGYKQRGEMVLYARAVRPWLQIRNNPTVRNWKGGPRIVRNALWSISRRPTPAGEWSASRIPEFEACHAALMSQRNAPAALAPKRDPESLNYALRCPAIAASAFLLLREGAPQGWFVLGRVARQMRIVDLWIASAEPREWQHAVATAALTAVRDPQVAEVTAAASIPITRQAFENSGFRNRGAVPIFVYDPKNLLPLAPLNLTLIDGDAAWWYDPAYPFLT